MSSSSRARATIIEWGAFSPEQVAARLVKATPFAPDLDPALIDDAWNIARAEASRRGAVLFDGPLLRLIRIDSTRPTLTLDLQPTSFRIFVGTNLRDPGLSAVRRADPLGISAVILSADRRLVLGRRSERVYGHPSSLHCIGGHAEPSHLLAEAPTMIDTFASIMMELVEELRVVPDQVETITCLGLARDDATLQPELIFCIRLAIPSTELSAANEEHDRLVFLGSEPVAVNRFLNEEGDVIVPVAEAALRMYLRQRSKEAVPLEDPSPGATSAATA
jgi:hypothetical protein